MRFDLALAALRLYKSRTLANLAIQDGAVLLNGQLVKPSHGVKPGDQITLTGPSGSRVCEVLELPRASLSRTAARELVRDLPASP